MALLCSTDLGEACAEVGNSVYAYMLHTPTSSGIQDLTILVPVSQDDKQKEFGGG